MSKSNKSKPTSITYRNAVKTLAEDKKRSSAGHRKTYKLQNEVGKLQRALQDKEELLEDAREDGVELECAFEYQQGYVDGFEAAHQEYQKQLSAQKKPAAKPALKKVSRKKG
jgi:flagellar biosynthesis/type III secretory pathway protein FliH